MTDAERPKLIRTGTLNHQGAQLVADDIRVDGDPRSESWSGPALPGGRSVRYGIWVGQPGSIAVAAYPHDEFFTVSQGAVSLECADGRVLEVGAGDTCLVRSGWKGTWRTVETTHKVFIIVEPDHARHEF